MNPVAERLSPNDLKSRELGWRWGQQFKQLDLPQGHPLRYLVRDALVGVADLGAAPKREHLITIKQSDPGQLRTQALAEWWKVQSRSATLQSVQAGWQAYIYESLIQDRPYPDLEFWYTTLTKLAEQEKSMPIKPPQQTDPVDLITSAIQDLPERFAPWEAERGQLYTLLLDMRVALQVHGPQLDETALSLENPEEAFTGYLEMYQEYYATVPDLDKARSKEEMEYGARLAWRVWQMLQRSGKPLEGLLEWFARLKRSKG